MAIRKLCINQDCMRPETRKGLHDHKAVCECETPTWRYQLDVVDISGKRVRQLFETKKKALEEEAKCRAMKAEKKSFLQIRKDYKTAFSELAEKYEQEIKHQVSYESYKKRVLKMIRAEFEGKKLSEVGYYDLESFRTKRQNTPTRTGGRRSASSLNKEVGTLTNMFNKAVEWDLIDKSPFDGKKTLRRKENNRRLRYLSEEEIGRLLTESPSRVRDFVEVAVHSGMRRGELLNLKWSDIAGGFIYLTKTKTDEPRQIPINDTLQAVFRRIRKAQWTDGINSAYVFVYRGKKFGNIRKAFMAALKRANITDFRIHDLRHTFASHYVMKGGTLGALQKILGHKDVKMTMRYAHLSSEFARQEIQLLNDLTNGKNVKDMSNSSKNAKTGENEKVASL